MRQIIEIALNDLRIIFRERGIWVNLFLIPLVLTVVIGFANGGASSASAPSAGPSILIDVIDQDSSDLSGQFLAELRAANANFVLCPLDNDAVDVCQLNGRTLVEPVAETRLQEQTSLALIELPAGFGAALDAGDDVSIVYRSNEDATAPSYILQAVQATVQRFGAAIVAGQVGGDVAADTPGLNLDAAGQAQFAADIRDRAQQILSQQPAVVTAVTGTAQEVVENSSMGGFSQSVPGMATMYVMFAVFPAAVALMTERKQGTLQRMVTLPLTRAQLLGGKLLARFLLGMIQYGIVFVFGYFLGVRYGNDPVAIGLTMVVFTLCITALTLALSTLLRNENQAGAITLLLTLTLAPLGGAWWPLEVVPEWMRNLGHISPVAWAMDSYSSLIFFDGRLADVLPYIGVLAAMTVAFFLLGILRFKVE
ncbi:MAG: ABC transporter permease [Anaerolineae bacterium]|nr:ABC transporter permease [Anaerolineae bacterium]